MQNVKVTGKGRKGPVPARLFILFARRSSTAVIFRRGPSKWVQLVKWNTKEDVFEPGQWFHGRIYERRSDLSPNGTLLIYFAQKIEARTLKEKEYTYAWTAVSKPPYLTAPALWPKGNCWHGGGLFTDNRTVVLNHRPDAATPHPDHKPKKLRVILKEHVCGEDDPLFSERLERDGWKLKQEWKVENRGYPELYTTVRPEVRHKFHGRELIQLTRSIERLDYAEEFAVAFNSHARLIPIRRASWVDWDQQGRLIVARDGKIFAGRNDGLELVLSQLIDLSLSKPEPVASPYWAKHW